MSEMVDGEDEGREQVTSYARRNVVACSAAARLGYLLPENPGTSTRIHRRL